MSGARKIVRDRRVRVFKTETGSGGDMTVEIKSLQCEDEGTYQCTIDTYRWATMEHVCTISIQMMIMMIKIICISQTIGIK